MKGIIIKLNDLKRKLTVMKDRTSGSLSDLSKGDRRKIWLKLYAGKIFTSFLVLLTGLVSVLSAGLSITLSGGDWNIGTVPSGNTTSSGNKWTVTGASDGREDIDIKVSNAGSWTPDSAGNAGSLNKFALRITDSGGTVVTGSDVRLRSSLNRNTSFNFGLWFKTPPLGSEAGAHTLTVTLTAKNFVPWCSGGYNVGGWCWRPSPHHGCYHHAWVECQYICNSYHGKGDCDWNGIAHYMYSHHGGACQIVQHYANHHHCFFHYQGHCHQAIAYCYHHNWAVTYSRSHGHHEHCHFHSHWSWNCWSRRMCSCTE